MHRNHEHKHTKNRQRGGVDKEPEEVAVEHVKHHANRRGPDQHGDAGQVQSVQNLGDDDIFWEEPVIGGA